MKNVVIVGYGETGQPLVTMCEENEFKTYIIDLNKAINEVNDEKLKECDYLHICIPYNESFIETVSNYIYQLNPKLTIIHSTIKPGTTAFIEFKTNKHVVHSLIKGIHPHLYKSYKTFNKFIGSSSEKTFNIAKQHLTDIGFKVKNGGTAEETELSKILSTSYYAWNILWVKEVYNICKKMGVNFDNVYTKLNEDYNAGYEKLGFKQYIRPILKPITGKIGGHCVIPNVKILKDLNVTNFSKFIIDKNNEYEYEV